MKQLKICVIGYARHGKDTCAEVFRDNYGYGFDSSSKFCSELFIFDKLKDKYNYETAEECFNDRVNHRAEWFDMIKEYVSNDPSILSREILKHNDIYVGIRDAKEFYASEKLFDLIIWVDASERLPKEDISSCNLDKSMADIIIDNNSTHEEFKRKVLRLGKILTHLIAN